MKIRLGTRPSLLARVQSADVTARIEAAGHEVETIPLSTAGDEQRDVRFDEIGSPGVFVKEIERALLEGRVDVAVHSYKDLPSVETPGLLLAAIPERLDPADRLLAREEFAEPGKPIPLREGARVGTASARRRALLAELRPDLEVLHLRGNLPRRVDHLRQGDFDAILLASAGLERLDRAALAGTAPPLLREGIVETRLDPRIFVPAPAQGAIAVQVRQADAAVGRVVAELDDAGCRRSTIAERELLTIVEGGCQVPFGAWSWIEGAEELWLTAILEKDGILRRAESSGTEPVSLAQRVWELLDGKGARQG